MSAPTTDRAVYIRFTSSKDQTCSRCGDHISRGALAGFDCTAGPAPLCGPCCGADTPAGPAQPATEQPPVAEPTGPATGEPRPAADTAAVRTLRVGGGDGTALPGDTGTVTKLPELPATVETPALPARVEVPEQLDESAASNAPELVHHDSPVLGPVAPRFDHDVPIGPAPCTCGQPAVDGSHRVDQPCAHTSTVEGPAPLPDLSVYAADAVNYGADPEQVAADVIEAVRLGILAGDVRGRQEEIGPSEIGHPCARALAYRLAGTPHTGTEPTPWRQRVGTLVHSDNDGHLADDNERRGTRWLTNVKVSVGELYPGREITGHLDVFDIHTGTVIDEKVPGSTAMKTYGPGKPEAGQYRRQVQLYGRGVLRAGYRPAWVSTLRLSPSRELSEYLFKPEPFDEQVAVDALARAGGIARMVDQLDHAAPPLLPPTEHVCHRCPWLRRNSTDLTTGCPGAPGADLGRTRASVDDLVG